MITRIGSALVALLRAALAINAPVTISFRCKGYADRRSLELHRRHDVIMERVWRARVARNVIERQRLERQARVREPLYVLQNPFRRQAT